MTAGCPVCGRSHSAERFFWALVVASELYRAGRRAGRRAGVAEVHRAARVIGGAR